MDSLMKAHADFTSANRQYAEARLELAKAFTEFEKANAELGATKERLETELRFYYLNQK